MGIVLNGLTRAWAAQIACIQVTIGLPAMAVAAEPNRASHYLLNGAAVSAWQLALGDESNWHQPQKDDIGLSANKAVWFNNQDNALDVRWRSKRKAGLVSLNRPAVDLCLQGDNVALALEVKVALALEVKVHAHKLKTQ